MENQLKKISVNFDLNQKALRDNGFPIGNEIKAYKHKLAFQLKRKIL